MWQCGILYPKDRTRKTKATPKNKQNTRIHKSKTVSGTLVKAEEPARHGPKEKGRSEGGTGGANEKEERATNKEGRQKRTRKPDLAVLQRPDGRPFPKETTGETGTEPRIGTGGQPSQMEGSRPGPIHLPGTPAEQRRRLRGPRQIVGRAEGERSTFLIKSVAQGRHPRRSRCRGHKENRAHHRWAGGRKRRESLKGGST